MIVFVIAIPVILLLVALMVFSSLRRRDADRVTGHLSSETRRRDRGAGTPLVVQEGTSAVEVEQAAQLARRGGRAARPAPPPRRRAGSRRRALAAGAVRPARRGGDRRQPAAVPQPLDR